MMPVGHPLSPGRAVAGAQDCFAAVLDQHRLPFQHHDELVLALVPVALAGDAAGLEDDVAYPEVGEPRGRRKPAVPAFVHGGGIRGGIAGRVDLRDGVEVELGHAGLSLVKPRGPC